jgi:Chromate transport protein ChrA
MNKLQILGKLFWAFLKVGSFTFGGGYAMLPLIQKEAVEKQKWVSEEEIVDVFAISQSVPGVISINSAIFIGNKVAKIPGAVAAALGTILPAFLSIIVILIALLSFQNNIYVQKALSGIRAASVGLIFLAAVSLGKTILKKNMLGWIIALVSFTVICLFNINAAWAVVGGGFIGYLVYALRRRIQ